MSLFHFSCDELNKKNHAKCIVELSTWYKHTGSLKNTREVLEKHGPQANASCTSQVFLKNLKCLYNSAMYEEQVFYFFYKMYPELHVVILMTVHLCDITCLLYGNIMNSF